MICLLLSLTRSQHNMYLEKMYLPLHKLGDTYTFSINGGRHTVHYEILFLPGMWGLLRSHTRLIFMDDHG